MIIICQVKRIRPDFGAECKEQLFTAIPRRKLWERGMYIFTMVRIVFILYPATLLPLVCLPDICDARNHLAAQYCQLLVTKNGSCA